MLPLAAVVLSCSQEDTVSPGRGPISPRGPAKDVLPVTYPHPDRGCYAWGPDPFTGGWLSYGDPTAVSVCGRTVSLEAVTDTSVDVIIWYESEYDPNTETEPHATYWEPGGNPGMYTTDGLGNAVITFDRPVTNVHFNWICSTVPGNTVEALDAAGAVIESHEAGVIDITQCGLQNQPTAEVTFSSLGIKKLKQVQSLTQPFHRFKGAFELWFTPDSTPPHLQLEAQPDSGFVGDTIRFYHSVSDGSPHTVTGWKWLADSTTRAGYIPKLPPDNCGVAWVCAATPGVSGWMWVYATVNGKPDSAKAHATMSVRACPPDGDPLMDSPNVRAGIMDAWSQYLNDGNEHMLAVYKNDDGSLRTIDISVSAAPCKTTFPADLNFADSTLIGFVHTHDVGTGHSSVCPTNLNSPDARKLSNGLSVDDMVADVIRHLIRQNAGLPDLANYVVDWDNIWRNQGTRENSVQRVPPLCEWR